MRYLYIIILLLVLAGMFIFGDKTPITPEVVASRQFVSSDKYYCTDEVEKYKKELQKAEEKINSLNGELKKYTSAERSKTSYSPNF